MSNTHPLNMNHKELESDTTTTSYAQRETLHFIDQLSIGV